MESIEDYLEELDYLVGKWCICQSCKIVDDDRGRSAVGSKCPTCGAISEGSQMYFFMSVHTLIDLMKEAFTTEPIISNEGTDFQYQINTHYISVLIFFCTLREILIYQLIRELCIAQNISKNVYERLNSDNKLYIQKQNKLFPSLAGIKWVDALRELSEETENDYISLNDKIIELVEYRNKFIHHPLSRHILFKIFDINKDVAEDCIKHIHILVQLFVDLHNKYVHKKVVKKTTRLITRRPSPTR